ncbi:outer membrane lipoprotein chaperone LolA [Oceanicoccus sagamiensis]|uniref:Outer-membrane lipoprotein carrier protein n=1 Tax=Oceanicoccus sagamiensis TaxID=716816 RepID=A0A1X9NF40_9GAMM|nr:outer membrane lipoprotein chaperone LolA [Oceanicoccus sagamiensis]ARN75781.1 outer membrane lipoprotein carrier protein LolA [Oceanicoccus sagamiensis]
MYLSLRYFLLLLLSGFSLTALSETAVQQLSAQLQAMNSLSAQFKQTITDNTGTVLQEASGTLTVKRPRRFYWRTEQPYEHLVVTDGKELWLYDIDLEQITQQAFTADLDKAPALLLSGEVDEISKQYQVNVTRAADNSLSFSLTPNQPDSLFKQLVISFNNKQLQSMQLKDSFEQLTTIEFSQLQLNITVADSLFKFAPPDGIDIIRDEP